MSRSSLLFCVVAALLQWSAVSAHLAPPKGYSVGFTATVAKGTVRYVCNQGAWIKTGSSATLSANLGTYGSIVNKLTNEETYYFTIVNSAGGYIESGHPKCGLQATAVKTVRVVGSTVLEYLAMVRVHRGAGDADQVAFVSLSRTRGGLPPRKELCSSYGAVSRVPFSGTFSFYTQDRQPPQVPVGLTPKANFLQVMFLEGKVVFKYAGGRWKYCGIYATVSDVAGGRTLGKFGTVAKADKYGSLLFLKVNDPNGFWMWAQLCAKPVQMTADGMPWQLMKITTNGGTQNPSLGEHKYALMGATMGGLAPSAAPNVIGTTWSSPFTAQLYMYTA